MKRGGVLSSGYYARTDVEGSKGASQLSEVKVAAVTLQGNPQTLTEVDVVTESKPFPENVIVLPPA